MKKVGLFYTLIIIIITTNGYQNSPKVPKSNHLIDIKKCPNNFYHNIKLKRCSPCACHKIGSKNNFCNHFGKCNCRPGYKGPKCLSCVSGYYKDPLRNECLRCNCNEEGTKSIECDINGQCNCKPGIGGKTCNRCLDLRMNFLHECTDHCPEMYNEIGEEFQKVLIRLDDLDEHLREFSMEKNILKELARRIRKLKEEVMSRPLTITSLRNLHNLLNMVESLQIDIRKYIKRHEDLMRLLNIIDEILKELAKITFGIVSSLDICAKTCNKAVILQKERDEVLTRLKNLQSKFRETVEEEQKLEQVAAKVRKEATFVKKWSGDIYNRAKSLIVPVFVHENIKEWDQMEFNSIMAKLNKLQEDVKMVQEIYKDVKVLEGSLLEIIVKSFKEIVINKYMSEISGILNNALQNINSSHNHSIHIINTLQLFKLEYNKYSDKLHRYQLEMVKYIADDKPIKDTLRLILNAVNELLRRTREEQKAVQEKRAAIATIKDKTRKLEGELISIGKEISEAQKEIETLEEYLTHLLTIRRLREEVEKLRIYSKEIEGLDSNYCEFALN